VIPAEKLARALQSDARSNVGAKVDEVRIIKRDATGRAEMMELSGERRRNIRGWDFKIIVGRALGWNLLKSSRFEVERVGANFVFRGSGFGHGLGLCQEGAHVMASSGIGYRQILARYFPGTSLRKEKQVSS
jgi:stage II sporulation protein D